MTDTPDSPYPLLPAGAIVLTVGELAASIKSSLERDFTGVWVEGEISEVSRPASGHIYFTLKDGQATLKCVMFRSQALRLPHGFEPRTGVAVVVLGRISFYPPKGDCQLYADRMLPKGIGQAELALQQLRARLGALGYFDPRRKKPLPRFPRSLCLIASSTGAAVMDMITTLRRRWPATRVAVRHSRVQGAGAAEEMAAALDQINRWKSQGRVQVDGIILGRGGGSSDDLSAFNEEVLAQAIFRSRIPIISAVGHEIDVSIADMVADHRAATPTHAAEMAVPDRMEIAADLSSLGRRMTDAMRRQTALLRRRLDDLARRRPLREPLERVRFLERRLDELSERLRRGIRRPLERRRRELESAAARLESLSPLGVLARGYTLTRAGIDGVLVRTVDQVKAGEQLVTELRRGRIVSRVETIDPLPRTAE